MSGFRLSSMLVCLFLLSCTRENKKNKDDIFGLKSYLKEEESRLDKHSAIKTVEQDGVSEKKLLSNVNWEKELSPFYDINLNPANKTDYRNVVHQEEGSSVSYITNNKNLVIRQVSFRFRTGNIQSIIVYKEEKNFLFTISQVLKYDKERGIEIISSEKVLWFKPKSFSCVINPV